MRRPDARLELMVNIEQIIFELFVFYCAAYVIAMVSGLVKGLFNTYPYLEV